jgi:polysaccharide export outer membrane protein
MYFASRRIVVFFSLISLIFCGTLFGQTYQRDLNDYKSVTGSRLFVQQGGEVPSYNNVPGTDVDVKNTDNGTPVSIFERYVSEQSFKDTTVLSQFGYDFFSYPSSSFLWSKKAPVTSDYIVGPEDEIRISLWGKIEGAWTVVVNKDGQIIVPKLGAIGVSGLNFKEVKELLTKEFSKYYTGFDINVSLNSLRTSRVYLVGNAKKPGAYNVSSLATLVTVLSEAGGPSKTGSMRKIQLKRGGKLVLEFDMYDFLMRGDKSKDIRIMPDDVFYIPPVGPLVAVKGNVNNPAIYELKEPMTVDSLINLAGGLTDLAFKGRLQLERVVSGSYQVVSESDLLNANKTPVRGGDILKIFPVDSNRKYVEVRGAVQRPGVFGLNTKMNVKTLLLMAGGLKDNAYAVEAELSRLRPTDNGPVFENMILDLNKVLAEDIRSNIELRPGDSLFVKFVPEWEANKYVKLDGEVRFPGVYTLKRGETVLSLIERAGGFTQKAYVKAMVFLRESVREKQQQSLDTMFQNIQLAYLQIQNQKTDPKNDMQMLELLKKSRTTKAVGRVLFNYEKQGSQFILEDGDRIVVPQKSQLVHVIGSLNSQSSFLLVPGKTVEDYIRLSGGLLQNSDEGKIYVIKADGSVESPSFFLLWRGSFSTVEPGDTIVVPDKVIDPNNNLFNLFKDSLQIVYQSASTIYFLNRL